MDNLHHHPQSQLSAVPWFLLSHINLPTLDEHELRKWLHLKDVEIARIDAGVELLIGVNAPKALEPWRIINSEDNGP